MTTSTLPVDSQPLVEDFWCDPQPFRDHVNQIMATSGASWRLVAAHAGVSPRAIRRLLGGRTRRIHRELARALMAVDVDDILTADLLVVPCHGTRRRLLDMITLGHTWARLAAELPGIDLDELSHRGTYYCTAAARARVQALYDATLEARLAVV